MSGGHNSGSKKHLVTFCDRLLEQKTLSTRISFFVLLASKVGTPGGSVMCISNLTVRLMMVSASLRFTAVNKWLFRGSSHMG